MFAWIFSLKQSFTGVQSCVKNVSTYLLFPFERHAVAAVGWSF